jgi:NTE family protein
LNRKQYANKGYSYYLGIQYFNGTEFYEQGSILLKTPGFVKSAPSGTKRQWFVAKISQENYFYNNKKLSVGYMFEGVLSNKPASKTYEETVLSSPAFYPLQDSRTLILANFRGPDYAVGGLRSVVNIKKNLEWRSEGYLFVAVQSINLNGLQDVSYSDTFGFGRLAISSGLVYQSFVGPISLSFNYYDDQKNRYGIMFHAGFLIFNKRALE